MARHAVPATLTSGELLRRLSGRIDRLDARLLLQHVVGMTHATLVAHPETPVSFAQSAILDALVERRAAGEPLAYLVGEAEFRGLRLAVSPAVLVPRPETELLVDLALARLPVLRETAVGKMATNTVSATRGAAAVAPVFLDLGTGSGAIPLAVKQARPDVRVIAVDISQPALAVACTNAERLGLAVEFVASDWYGNLPQGLLVDVLVSNPPYVAAGDPHLAGDGVRYEPLAALTDGGDGLSALRQIVLGAGMVLKTGGWLLLEHGYDQAIAVRGMLAGSGFDKVQTWADLAGIQRVSGGCRLAG